MSYAPASTNTSTSENVASASHVSRSECHNCRTLGLECSAVHKDTKCDKCLLMGMDCDTETLRRRSGSRQTARSKCTADREACGRGMSCNPGIDCMASHSGQDSSASQEGSAGGSATKSARKEHLPAPTERTWINTYCGGCGDIFAHRKSTPEEQCYRCEVSTETRKAWPATPRSLRSILRTDNAEAPSLTTSPGQMTRTCTGGFEPKLDLGSMARFCQPYEISDPGSRARSCQPSETSRDTASNRNQEQTETENSESAIESANVVEDSINTPMSNVMGVLGENEEKSRRIFPATPVALAQRALLVNNNNKLDETAHYLANAGLDTTLDRPSARLSPSQHESASWSFRPCTSCEMNGRLCDHALPQCAQCRESLSACRYTDANAVRCKPTLSFSSRIGKPANRISWPPGRIMSSLPPSPHQAK